MDVADVADPLSGPASPYGLTSQATEFIGNAARSLGVVAGSCNLREG